MNKTKIDWVDYSWNPVTGCLHDCEYCYARRIANRFGKNGCSPSILRVSSHPNYPGVWEQHEKPINPYPHMFAPTFHKYRLDEPAKKTKGVTIFVCSMADLFGEWVPAEWIKEVFEACEKAPQHRYLFLTKNPKRYGELVREDKLLKTNNMWYGTTITKNMQDTYTPEALNTFVSIEPIHGPIDFTVDGDKYFKWMPKWIIVGAETGNRKDKVVPKKEWIMNIKEQCQAAGVPLFMKESLKELMSSDFIQEFPEGLR